MGARAIALCSIQCIGFTTVDRKWSKNAKDGEKIGSFVEELKLVPVHETWLQIMIGAKVFQFNEKFES